MLRNSGVEHFRSAVLRMLGACLCSGPWAKDRCFSLLLPGLRGELSPRALRPAHFYGLLMAVMESESLMFSRPKRQRLEHWSYVVSSLSSSFQTF